MAAIASTSLHSPGERTCSHLQGINGGILSCWSLWGKGPGSGYWTGRQSKDNCKLVASLCGVTLCSTATWSCAAATTEVGLQQDWLGNIVHRTGTAMECPLVPQKSKREAEIFFPTCILAWAIMIQSLYCCVSSVEEITLYSDLIRGQGGDSRTGQLVIIASSLQSYP